MTKSQESPPLSRREARERERGGANLSQHVVRRASTSAPTAAGDLPDVDTPRRWKPESPQESQQGPAQEPFERESLDEIPEPLSASQEPVTPFSYDPPSVTAIPLGSADTDADSRHHDAIDASDLATLREHTMTRRQLRQLREAQAAVAGEATTPPDRAHSEHDPAAERAAVEAPPAESAFPEKTRPFANIDSGAKTQTTPQSQSKPFTPPVGHWSIAAQQENDAPDFDQLISPGSDGSDYGTGSTIILPSVASGRDSMRPVGKSGEALATGSIDLPLGMSSTGAHPRFDSSELDRMFDHDEQRMETANVHTASVEPVRASSAVSTHTSTRDVVSTSKGHDNRLPIVLAVSAGVMAVGVFGLFVAGAIWGAF